MLLPEYQCYFFEEPYIIAYALESIIQLGKDYTDPEIMQNAINNVDFIGCSGRVKFKNHFRTDVNFLFKSLQEDSQGKWDFIYNGKYCPACSIVWDFETEILYFAETTIVPQDHFPQYQSCNFTERHLYQYDEGKRIVDIIMIVIAVISFALLILGYKIWKGRQYTKITDYCEKTMEDDFFFFIILIHSGQYVALGPNLKSLNNLLSQLVDLLSLNIDERDVYIIVFWVCIGASVLFFLLLFSFLAKLEIKYENRLTRALGFLSFLLLPLIGELLYMPILFVLTDMFVCIQGVDWDLNRKINYTESFLEKDCYLWCGSSEHKLNVVFSAFSLLIFFPLAFLSRPHWQDMKDTSLHIKEKPLSILLKAELQQFLVTINRILKIDYKEIHGFLFTFIILLYTIIQYKLQPYTYDRANIFQTAILAIVVTIGFFTTISSLLNSTISLAFILAILVISAFDGAITMLIMKKYYPKYLKQDPIDTTVLFRFAYRCDANIEMMKEHLEVQKERIARHSILKNIPSLHIPSSTIQFSSKMENFPSPKNISVEKSGKNSSNLFQSKENTIVKESFQTSFKFKKQDFDSIIENEQVRSFENSNVEQIEGKQEDDLIIENIEDSI